jgi:tetratricopeptide (TPR) repeat protein
VAAIYERLLPFREVIIHAYNTVSGSAKMILGYLAAALGRYDEAEGCFAAATKVHERIGAQLFLSRTHLYHAEMLLARAAAGDHDRAAELLEHAIALAHGCGGAAIEHEATAILDQARAPPTRSNGSAAVPVRRG